MTLLYITVISISVDIKNCDASEFSTFMSKLKKLGRGEFLQRKGFDVSKSKCFTKAKSIQEVAWSLWKCKPKFPEKKEISFYATQEVVPLVVLIWKVLS